ncbi:MAG: hypothetical protein EBY16_00245 [Gammaproteobacteria bacterium]|nr:hypothetical protein [Gammaproteobacteria bacterium]
MPLLFSAQHLVPLAKKNLGLRLTGNTNESKSGGFGDAIPLSHLAGAKDIIEFVTLSFLPELPRERMEAIYNRYKQIDVHSTDCMPRLILHYAAQHNIGDARERLSYKKNDHVTEGYIKLQVGAIASEAKKPASFYSSSKFVYPLDLVVKNLPYLAEELAYNFNEKLQLRLAKNYYVYATSDDMDYLFLTDDSQKSRNYEEGYDFNNYPLGKIGSRQFDSSNVVKQMMFLGGENRTSDSEKNLEDRIFNSIKDILKNELYASLGQLRQGIELKLSQHSNYPEDFKNACNGMIALVARLQENEQLSSEESIGLLKKTASLIDNPAEYKAFLTEAKSYRMVDGGRLAAYMMLIAGWAAKIVTVNYAGNAWIRLANEKLDYLAMTEECADASEAYSKSM